MPFPSEPSNFRTHGSPVSWIIDSFHQAVRLKAVHQLGDVGAHAGEFLGQLAEAHRPVLGHQDAQRTNFRAGQPHARQRLLQARLDAVSGMHQR